MRDLILPGPLLRSVRLSAALGGVAMASTGELEFSFLAVFIGLFLLGIKVETFPTLAHFLAKFQPFLATFFFVLGLADFFFLSNSFLLSVAHFLLCLQGLRLLSLRSPRDSLGSVLLSSLMILSASTLAVEWTFFVMLFLFLPIMIWTLVLLNLTVESQQNEDSAVNPTQGFLREGSWSWKKILPLVRLNATVAFFVAAFCCVVVFVAFPRFNFQGFRGRFLQPVHKTGFTKQVNLKKGGRIFQDQSIVMRVEINPEDRRLWPGYIRGSILDEFDGTLWKNSSNKSVKIFNNGQGDIQIPTNRSLDGDRLQQSIYLESMESPILFAVHKPVMMRLPRPFLLLGDDGTVQRAFGDSWRIHYEVESILRKPYEKEQKKKFQRVSKPLYVGEKEEAFLALNVPVEKIRSLAVSLAGNTQSDLAVASRISNYLSTTYQYTVNLGPGQGDQPLEQFIFQTKKGHCEYFASAMTVMLRSINIPARLVTGFHSHEWNERGHYVVVRMKHAHAWVEAFVEPYGWVEFDPSPRVWEAAPGGWDWTKRIAEVKDFLNLRWNRYILSYDLERQVEIVGSVNRQSRQISARLDKWVQSFRASFEWYGFKFLDRDANENAVPQPAMPLLPVAVMVALVGGVLLIVFVSSKRKKEKVWFYKPLLSALEKYREKKSDTQTLEEFVTQLKPHLGLAFKEAELLTRQYYRCRFSGSASLAPAENRLIHSSLKKLKKPN